MFPQIALTLTLTEVIRALLHASGKHAVNLQGQAKSSSTAVNGYIDDGDWQMNPQPQTQGVSNMGPFEIVGNDGYGSIGAESLLIGDDDALLEALISGLGTTEIVGDEGGSASGNPARQAAIQRILQKGGAAVIQNQLNRRRRFPIGFALTTVASGNQSTIPAAPQNLFRGERPVVPSDIAFDFGVVDTKVGNQSQFAQQSEVPAVVFSEVSIDTHMTFDTAEVGNQLSIVVRNKSAGPIEFTGAVMGTVAKAG